MIRIGIQGQQEDQFQIPSADHFLLRKRCQDEGQQDERTHDQKTVTETVQKVPFSDQTEQKTQKDPEQDGTVSDRKGLQVVEADLQQDGCQDQVFEQRDRISDTDPVQCIQDPRQDLSQGIEDTDLFTAVAASSFQKQKAQKRNEIERTQHMSAVIAAGAGQQFHISADTVQETAHKKADQKQKRYHILIILPHPVSAFSISYQLSVTCFSILLRYNEGGGNSMKQFRCIVENPMGIHARPAALLAQLCVSLSSSVTLSCKGRIASGNDVLQILALDAKKNDTIEVKVEGEYEEADALKVKAVLCNDCIEEEGKAVLKIAFFNTKDYDRLFFTKLEEEKGPGTYNCEITYLESRLTKETAALAAGHDAICIFVNDDASKEVIDILHQCNVSLILLRCAGFNNVDLDACKEYGITVLRVPAYSPYAVAEHAMAILQEANRRLHKADRKVRENNFALSGLLGVDLHNKICGVMGTGKIGECFARIAKGYGMNVIAWDPYPNRDLVNEGLLRYVSKEELLEKADLISLHVPLIMGENGTYHLIDREAIARMKDRVMLVNTARGPLIDAEALIEALKQGKFQAVALDVYEGEDENVYNDRSDEALPHSITARLQMFPQLVLTSHQAFFTREAMQAIAVTTMENARNFNEGRDPGQAKVV